MTRPGLVRWVSAQFAPIATATLTDPYSREARATSTHGTSVSVRAQVSDGGANRSRGPGGEDPRIVKTALVRRSDCTTAGWTPRAGDRYLGTLDRYGSAVDTAVLYVVTVRNVTSGFRGDLFVQLGLGDDAPARKVA